jgi:predicted O-methyltransferase YrrM
MINSVLEKIYVTNHVEDNQGNSINVFLVATPQIVAEYLYEFVQSYNCNQTLEIGMAYGLSSVAICQAHADKGFGSHIAIDPFQNKGWKSVGLLNVKSAGLAEKLRFIEASSVIALPQLVAEDEKLDLAFIDGGHLFDYTLLEFFYIDMLLEMGGLIVFDDLWMPSIRKVVSFVLKNRAYKLLPLKPKSNWKQRLGRSARRIQQTQLSWESGLKWSRENICIVQKQGDDRRKWDFYRDF